MNDSRIELAPEDLVRLYGGKFFLVANERAAKQEAEETGPEKLPEDEKQPETAPAEKEASPKAEKRDEIPEKEAGEQEKEPQPKPQTAPPIVWKPKPSSRVLFIIHQAELRDKALAELLKKIVQSIGIPFEAAGFGIVTGPVGRGDLEALPNPFGVVFDSALQQGEANPWLFGEKEIFFTHRLAELQDDKDRKRALWEYLKHIKENLENE